MLEIHSWIGSELISAHCAFHLSTAADEGSINSTLLISWSQSNCAVQYVVTIINSSDGRVYPNITTSKTDTTVTLPTGVEFCVTLVAVDSIGRRGPDTTPVCYQFELVMLKRLHDFIKIYFFYIFSVSSEIILL